MPAVCTCTGGRSVPHRGSSGGGKNSLMPMSCWPGHPCLLLMPFRRDGKRRLSPSPGMAQGKVRALPWQS